MFERRREERVPEENKVIIEFYRKGCRQKRAEEHFALTQDISVGGAKILTDRRFPDGTRFVITITLRKSTQVMKVEGRVKWVKRIGDDLYETGVEFLHEISNTILTMLNHIHGQTKAARTGQPN